MSVTTETDTSTGAVDPDAALTIWSADRLRIDLDWEKAARDVAPEFEDTSSELVDALAGIGQSADDDAVLEETEIGANEPLMHRVQMRVNVAYRQRFFMQRLLESIAKREEFLRAIGRPNDFHNLDGGPRLKVAIVNIKGGVAKTTTTVYLGSLLSEIVRRQVVVLDVNNEGNGDAAQRLGINPFLTLMLHDAYERRAEIFKSYGSSVDRMPMTRHGVSCITVDDVRDPDAEELRMLSAKDHYEELIELAHENCGFLMIDTSNGLNSSANVAAIEAADVVIFVADATQGSSLERLRKSMVRYAHMSDELREKVNTRSIIALKGASAGRIPSFKQLIGYNGPCVAIPIDPVIARDAPVDLSTIHPVTYAGFLDLAIDVIQITRGHGVPMSDPATWGPPEATGAIDRIALPTSNNHPDSIPNKEE